MLELRAIGLNMVETNTYNEVFPANILDKYTFMETGSASKIAEAVCPLELNDIIEVLNDFVLSSRLLLTKGEIAGQFRSFLTEPSPTEAGLRQELTSIKGLSFFRGRTLRPLPKIPWVKMRTIIWYRKHINKDILSTT